MNRKALESEMGIALNRLINKFKYIGFVGRCWGILKNNPHGGSHVTLAQGDEIVSVHVNTKGKAFIHEYKRTNKKTVLGDEVRERLLEGTGLEIANP